jgi:hypothetical protein
MHLQHHKHKASTTTTTQHKQTTSNTTTAAPSSSELKSTKTKQQDKNNKKTCWNNQLTKSGATIRLDINRTTCRIKKSAPPNAQDAVQKIIEDYKKSSQEEKCYILRVSRIVKTFDPNRKKVVLSRGPSPKARSTVIGILCSLENWEYKVGSPPPGHMERERGAWLKELLN